jgi:hypothetical protein
MTDYIGLIQGRLLLVAAAAIGLFGVETARLCAEVLAQAGRAPALDLGELQEPKRLAFEEIKVRGIKLRADLDKVFNGLLDSGKVGQAGDFTPVFQPYIPAGMAVEDAEDILRAAGFTEPPRPGAGEEQDRTRRDRYVVVAEIPQFSRRVFGNVEAFIMPLPESLAVNAGRRRRMVYYGHP